MEAAILDAGVWVREKMKRLGESCVFFLPFCYSELCLDMGKAELMRQIPNVFWFIVVLSSSKTGLLDD